MERLAWTELGLDPGDKTKFLAREEMRNAKKPDLLLRKSRLPPTTSADSAAAADLASLPLEGLERRLDEKMEKMENMLELRLGRIEEALKIRSVGPSTPTDTDGQRPNRGEGGLEIGSCYK